MAKYVGRLVLCGYTIKESYKICNDFLKDFSLFDLENFIEFIEGDHKCG